MTSLVTITSLTITNSRRKVLLNIAPNAFPATRFTAKRDIGDDRVVDYVQVSRHQTFLCRSILIDL